MGRMILVTGGARSGKSKLAERLALAHGGSNVLYLATAPHLDTEMDERIQAHRIRRSEYGWNTEEREIDLEGVFQNCTQQVVLLDCITLWLNNLLWKSVQAGIPFAKPAYEKQLNKLLAAISCYRGTTIIVTNEVGSGLVPEAPESRLFRDLAGFGNQLIAVNADIVLLCVSGIPLTLKGQQNVNT